MNDIRFSLPITDIQTKDYDPEGVVMGLASTYDRDLMGDVMVRGCWSKSLEKHEKDESRPAMLYQHQMASPIGRWDEIYESDAGLEVRGQLAKGVRLADEAFKLGEMGALALSVGFRPVKSQQKADGNHIIEADLVEISMVSMPANRQARLSVKSMDLNTYQRFLRESGLSVRQAKRLARHGWNAFNSEETGAEVLAEFLAQSADKYKL